MDTLCRKPQDRSSETDLENMPDNTQKLTNLCVKGLDECLTEEDLHIMFRVFGDIKSLKVARDKATSKSLGYGFVWFADEYACAAAIKASENQTAVGYQCEFYQNVALRN